MTTTDLKADRRLIRPGPGALPLYAAPAAVFRAVAGGGVIDEGADLSALVDGLLAAFPDAREDVCVFRCEGDGPARLVALLRPDALGGLAVCHL